MLRSPIAPRGSRKDWLPLLTDLPPKLHEEVLRWGVAQGFQTRQEVGLAIYRRFFGWDSEKDEPAPEGRTGTERRLGPRRKAEKDSADHAA